MIQSPTNIDTTYAHQTRVFCLLSDQRVFRSRTPEMFSAVIGRTGINGAYVPFMVDGSSIGKALDSLRVLNIAGANVTAPFKQKVVPFLDVLSEGANIIGAVNTIVCKKNQLKGYNTNAIGVMDALDQFGFDVTGKSALVIGTGGAARAVVFILNWLRADSVVVAGRNAEQTCRLTEHFGCTACSLEELIDRRLDVDIIVNATSVSSRSESHALTTIAGSMTCNACQLVFDLNYDRRESIWQSLADRNRVPFMDGLSTLAYQARRTFMLWTGQDVPQDEFLKALVKQ